METKEKFLTSLVETYGMTKRVNVPKSGVIPEIGEYYTSAIKVDENYDVTLTEAIPGFTGGNEKLLPLLRWLPIWNDCYEVGDVPNDLGLREWDRIETGFRKIERIMLRFNRRIKPFNYEALKELCKLYDDGSKLNFNMSADVETNNVYTFTAYVDK